MINGIRGCYASTIRRCDGVKDLGSCLKVVIVASIILMGVGLAASWVPQMPSSLISPCLKIGGMLTGGLIFYKIMRLPPEAASTSGRRLKITLLVAAILIVVGTVTSHLFTGGPAGLGQAATYIGIPLVINSALHICLRKYGSTLAERLGANAALDSLKHALGISE